MSNDFYTQFKFPDIINDVPKNDHGWYPKENEALLTPKVKDKKLVVELGSWLGKSTRVWLNNSDAKVVCVDTWRGSVEHTENRKDIKGILPSLKDTFLKKGRTIAPPPSTGEWKLFH